MAVFSSRKRPFLKFCSYTYTYAKCTVCVKFHNVYHVMVLQVSPENREETDKEEEGTNCHRNDTFSRKANNYTASR